MPSCLEIHCDKRPAEAACESDLPRLPLLVFTSIASGSSKNSSAVVSVTAVELSKLKLRMGIFRLTDSESNPITVVIAASTQGTLP